MSEDRTTIEIEPTSSSYNRWKNQLELREHDSLTEFIEVMVDLQLADLSDTAEREIIGRELRRQLRSKQRRLEQAKARFLLLEQQLEELKDS